MTHLAALRPTDDTDADRRAEIFARVDNDPRFLGVAFAELMRESA